MRISHQYFGLRKFLRKDKSEKNMLKGIISKMWIKTVRRSQWKPPEPNAWWPKQTIRRAQNMKKLVIFGNFQNPLFPFLPILLGSGPVQCTALWNYLIPVKSNIFSYFELFPIKNKRQLIAVTKDENSTSLGTRWVRRSILPSFVTWV